MDEDHHETKGQAIIADLMERAWQYSIVESAWLMCGPPGNTALRLVDGREWEVVRPLLVDWLDARIKVVERATALRRCTEAFKELCRSSDYGTDAHNQLIEVALADQARAKRSLYHANRDERYIAQQLEDLGVHVAI